MKQISRRDFLKLTAASLGTLVASSCGLLATAPASTPTVKPGAPTRSAPTPGASPSAPDDLPRNAEAIVIGAGLAGLAAARQPADWDYDVIILEARERIGGRVWTDRSLGLPLDMGASWIHGVNGNPLTDLADDLDVERAATDYDSITRYKSDGAEFTAQEDADLDALFGQFYEQVAEWQEETDNDMSLPSPAARTTTPSPSRLEIYFSRGKPRTANFPPRCMGPICPGFARPRK